MKEFHLERQIAVEESKLHFDIKDWDFLSIDSFEVKNVKYWQTFNKGMASDVYVTE